MASAYTLCRGNVGGVASIGRGRLLVSVQGDGVSCYDTSDRVSRGSLAAMPNRQCPIAKQHACCWGNAERMARGRCNHIGV